jgi:hypothetical protein
VHRLIDVPLENLNREKTGKKFVIPHAKVFLHPEKRIFYQTSFYRCLFNESIEPHIEGSSVFLLK